jgi:hypothetical protein
MVYQQQVHYIQTRGLQTDPVTSFDSDLSKQIKEWRGAGERIVLVIDMNSHPLHNDLYQQLQEPRTEMEEFAPKAPYTHPAGESPIDGAYKSTEVEIINLCMLTFAESPDDHRSLCFDISTCSLLGEFRYKICRPVSQRLVTSQPSSVKRYNKIVHGNIPAIVAALICLQSFGKSKTCFDGPFYFPYMMGLGQGNRAAPPPWIQLSVVLVNVFKQLNLCALIQDPITAEVIHSMGALLSMTLTFTHGGRTFLIQEIYSAKHSWSWSIGAVC